MSTIEPTCPAPIIVSRSSGSSPTTINAETATIKSVQDRVESIRVLEAAEAKASGVDLLMCRNALAARLRCSRRRLPAACFRSESENDQQDHRCNDWRQITHIPVPSSFPVSELVQRLLVPVAAVETAIGSPTYRE
jgi:hypothetical protein